MIDVLVVEDNEVFREALEVLLGLEDGIRVVAAVGDGAAAVEECRAHRADVALVDYRLPGEDGVETTKALRRTCPGTAVVVLTAAAREPEVEALIEAGAVACLGKEQELDEIVAAIRRAAGRDAL